MTGKITIDFNFLEGEVSKVDNNLEAIALKSFRVAFAVLSHLDEIRYEGRIEIIKITWKYPDSRRTTQAHQKPSEIDFQVVFRPLLWGYIHEKFQVVARWCIGGKTVTICEPEDPSGKPMTHYSSFRGLNLPNETVNTLADAVIEAMKAIIMEKQAFYEYTGEQLAKSKKALILSAESRK